MKYVWIFELEPGDLFCCCWRWASDWGVGEEINILYMSLVGLGLVYICEWSWWGMV